MVVKLLFLIDLDHSAPTLSNSISALALSGFLSLTDSVIFDHGMNFQSRFLVPI